MSPRHLDHHDRNWPSPPSCGSLPLGSVIDVYHVKIDTATGSWISSTVQHAITLCSTPVARTFLDCSPSDLPESVDLETRSFDCTSQSRGEYFKS